MSLLLLIDWTSVFVSTLLKLLKRYPYIYVKTILKLFFIIFTRQNNLRYKVPFRKILANKIFWMVDINCGKLCEVLSKTFFLWKNLKSASFLLAPKIIFYFFSQALTCLTVPSLTLSWRRSLSYRNQSIDLQCK